MSEGSNIRPNSMFDVLGTVTHVLDAWEECVRLELGQGIAVQFDEGLSYETAQKLLRENNDYSDQVQDGMPMLAYKRTVARRIEDHLLGKRASNFKACVRNSEGQLVLYNIAYVEFDILFAFFTKDIELQERFEIAYNNRQGISELQTFVAKLPEIGDMRYSIKWNDLDEYTIQEDENNYFKSLIGSAKVRGWFFSFDSIAKEIGEIHAQIISSSNLSEPDLDELLGQCIIKVD
jgi:hypothetical protein